MAAPVSGGGIQQWHTASSLGTTPTISGWTRTTRSNHLPECPRDGLTSWPIGLECICERIEKAIARVEKERGSDE